MKVAVLMGGLSAEREVSLSSGKAVARGLESRGHHVSESDVQGHSSGRWEAFDRVLGSRVVREADVVFIALHGDEGENGTVQALLELRRRPYTGSRVLASALAMDKVMSKKMFDLAGIPNPEWALVSSRSSSDEILAAVESVGGIPSVVKPVDQGSTVGVTVVRGQDCLEGAVEEAGKFSERVLVERYIPGREVTVSVLGDEALPLVEIIPEGGFYDYECKYTKGMSRYVCPAVVSKKRTREIQDLALKAFRLLGCEGFGRVDLRLTEEEDPFFLEINTVPGMTATSLVPMAARAVGIEFPELVERICLLALQRDRSDSRRRDGETVRPRE
jgi:D-alanine-D-alanine ligase